MIQSIKNYSRLLLLLFLLLLSLVVLEHTKKLEDKEFSSVMRDAARRTEQAFGAIREEKTARGFSVSSLDDPNHTGLIGEPFTSITTTLGNLEAKRSTTNPNIAAMIVDMFHQLGLRQGDKLAVNLSSSFPCVNLAVLCAMDAMELDGIIMNSVGASTYGANIPEFTYLDMEHFLYDNGYVKNHTTYFSMGGGDDIGKEMPEDVKDRIKDRLTGFGYQFLYYPDLEENMEARFQIYTEGSPVSCFVNAGGNILSFGGGSEMAGAANGIILPSKAPEKATGLIPEFLRKQTPVLHLLNMKDLLTAYNLPIDPMPVPKAGEGGVYQDYTYSKIMAYPLAVLNLICFLWAVKDFKKV